MKPMNEEKEDEVARLKRELEEQKKAYRALQQKKFVNIFDQPPTMFDVMDKGYGRILVCKECKSEGGTRSLTHDFSCPYTNTQVWYQNDGVSVLIYDVAMFDSRRRF